MFENMPKKAAGGMMKKKGYAKGGMMKKGYAKGGMMKKGYKKGGKVRGAGSQEGCTSGQNGKDEGFVMPKDACYHKVSLAIKSSRQRMLVGYRKMPKGRRC